MSSQNEYLQNLLLEEVSKTNGLKEQIRLFQQQIHEKDVEQVQYKSHIAHVQNQFNIKDHELNGIYQSNGWNILRKYYKLRDTLLPDGSRQRKASKVFVNFRPYSRKLFRHINQYGVTATVTKVKGKVFPASLGDY